MLNETFGRMMLPEITPPTIEKWKQKRRQENPARVNRELCVLSESLEGGVLSAILKRMIADKLVVRLATGRLERFQLTGSRFL